MSWLQFFMNLHGLINYKDFICRAHKESSCERQALRYNTQKSVSSVFHLKRLGSEQQNFLHLIQL